MTATDELHQSQWTMCDFCRWRDNDGAGHFMCLDYSPPEMDGEVTATAQMVECEVGQHPRSVCASYSNVSDRRTWYAF